MQAWPRQLLLEWVFRTISSHNEHCHLLIAVSHFDGQPGRQKVTFLKSFDALHKLIKTRINRGDSVYLFRGEV